MSKSWSVGYGSRGAANAFSDPPPGGGSVPALHRVGLSASHSGIDASESSKRQSTLDNYASMATALGNITAAELRALGGRHVYDNNGVLTTWNNLTICNNNIADGYGTTVLNQTVNMASWASGALDAAAQTFLNSVPAGHKLVWIIQHEPENGNFTTTDQANWRAGTARFAKIVHDRNNPLHHFSVCYIPGSYAAAWDWIPELQALDPTNWQSIAARTFLGMDPYPEVGTKNNQPYVQTLEDKCRAPINFYRTRGQSGPLFFPEVGFYNWRILTSSAYTLTYAQQAQRIHDELWTWGQANGLIGYYYFDVYNPDDPATWPHGEQRALNSTEEFLEYGKLIRGDYYL